LLKLFLGVGWVEGWVMGYFAKNGLLLAALFCSLNSCAEKRRGCILSHAETGKSMHLVVRKHRCHTPTHNEA
jgi:hypothetical protein